MRGRRVTLSEGQPGSAARTAVLRVGETLKTWMRAGVAAANA